VYFFGVFFANFFGLFFAAFFWLFPAFFWLSLLPFRVLFWVCSTNDVLFEYAVQMTCFLSMQYKWRAFLSMQYKWHFLSMQYKSLLHFLGGGGVCVEVSPRTACCCQKHCSKTIYVCYDLSEYINLKWVKNVIWLTIHSVHFFDTICRQKGQKSCRFGHYADAVVVRAGKKCKTVKHTIFTSKQLKN